MCAHVAHRALCARIGHNTRIETGAVSADLLVTAVIVRTAARGRRRREVASNIGVSDISGQTGAEHGPLGQRVLDTALGIDAAGGEHSAGVPAHLIEASQATRAVSVNTTLRLRLGDWIAAGPVRVASVPLEALTSGPM